MSLSSEVIINIVLFGVVALIVSFVLGLFRGKRTKREGGNAGEAAVRKKLMKHCGSTSSHLMNNITLRYGDGTTQIDHILITKKGVLIIETKHYSGWLFANEKSKKWMQVIFKVKHGFQNPIFQNKKHISAVRNVLDFLPKGQVGGLVVFTGKAKFKTPIPSGVILYRDLESYVSKLDFGEISANRVQFCVGRLECLRLDLTGKTDIEHQKYLEKKFGASE